ncbi:uncharacterized protein LOC144116336 [Amblyomma americanum]
MDPALHGVIIGDSQVKFLNWTRLYVPASMRMCPFSYGGADARRLMDIIRRMPLKPLHIVAKYVCGNDLCTERSPEDIADDIKKLVQQAARVARKVFLFRTPPRLSETEEQKERRRRLDKFLVRSLAASDDVVLVGVQGRFIAGGQAKRALYAADGYHVSRGCGVKALAKAFSLALKMTFRHVFNFTLPCGHHQQDQNMQESPAKVPLQNKFSSTATYFVSLSFLAFMHYPGVRPDILAICYVQK